MVYLLRFRNWCAAERRRLALERQANAGQAHLSEAWLDGHSSPSATFTVSDNLTGLSATVPVSEADCPWTP